MKFMRFICLLIFPLYFISCSTQYRVPHYLENVTDTTFKDDVKFPELRIQKSDELSIQVYDNSDNPELSSKLYNLPNISTTPGSSTTEKGFLVDMNGNIEYPRIGTIQVAGLTKRELADIIKSRFLKELNNPSVIIRFLNFRIIMLGEVGSQGVITSRAEKMTILEAIGQAGGISDFGNKNKVKVIREVEGKIEVGNIDLASKEIFKSPYFNLMQNDVVLVDPTKLKTRLTDQGRVIQQVSFALSLITAAAFIYNIFK